MEHYLLACGLRRFTCRWKKIHDKHFRAFMQRVDLKSFIHVNRCKSSQIKISNYRIKSNLVKHQMCPKYSLLSPPQIHCTSASFLKRNNFLGRWKRNEPFVALSFPASLLVNPTAQSHPAVPRSTASYYSYFGGEQTQNQGQEVHSHNRSHALRLRISELIYWCRIYAENKADAKIIFTKFKWFKRTALTWLDNAT